jgi:hypothetical protein
MDLNRITLNRIRAADDFVCFGELMAFGGEVQVNRAGSENVEKIL